MRLWIESDDGEKRTFVTSELDNFMHWPLSADDQRKLAGMIRLAGLAHKNKETEDVEVG